ncbi:MAG: phosphotriesterase family protein [Clostridia bacterium]
MIYTATGPIRKEELGVTLSHEHIAWDSQADERLYFDRVYDEDKLKQLYDKLLPVFQKLYQQGCRAVAETSPPEGGQNLKLMQRLSRATGVRIIPNTGLFFSKNVYRIHKENYEKELADRWIDDFENGLDTIDGVFIRPSHIKIFISRGELPEVERKILGAAVMTSKATGLPVHCHINEALTANGVFDFLETIKCDYSKFLWAHASYEGNEETIRRAADMDMWLGFDNIRPDNCSQYCDLIKKAMKIGYQDRILLSQDYDFYEQFMEKGNNHPCTSIFTDFIPYCEENGLSKDSILNMMTSNPAEFYDI